MVKKIVASSFGYSMMEVLVGISLLAGASMSAIQIGKYGYESKARHQANESYLNLKKTINLLISNKDACEATFSTLTFKGTSLNNGPTPTKDLTAFTDPLHGIKLKYKLNDGTLGPPIVSHDPADVSADGRPLNKFGRVEVIGTELVMPSNTTMRNLDDSNDSIDTYPFNILTHTRSEISPGKFIDNPLIKNRIYLAVKTDASGDSEVVGCKNDPLTNKQIFRAEFSSPVTDQLLQDGAKDKFIFCGLTKQYHRPDKQDLFATTARSSYYRCKLEPSGVGPYYSWSFTLINQRGNTSCEVVCI